MNKRLVQRAMQKLVDQNPSRPLHQHTTITPTTTITPSTTTPRTLSQGNATLMASSAEAEEAMAAGIRADIARAKVLVGVREYPSRVKCATLSWHTLDAALHGQSAAKTE